MNEIRIQVVNLVKEYTQGEQLIMALDHICFSIASGEFISITGRSGSGKSTLLNVLAGLTIPTSGSVLLEGKDLFTLSDDEISMYRNSRIGCVPQVSSILANLTVLDNVRLPFHLAKRKGDSSVEALRLLRLVGIEKLAARMPKRLSGGQLKRVVIARALMNEPDFLFADEPTGDLDAQTTEEIISVFKKMTDEGVAVLMVTHDLDVTEYTDSRYKMDRGVLSEIQRNTCNCTLSLNTCKCTE